MMKLTSGETTCIAVHDVWGLVTQEGSTAKLGCMMKLMSGEVTCIVVHSWKELGWEEGRDKGWLGVRGEGTKTSCEMTCTAVHTVKGEDKRSVLYDVTLPVVK